MQRRDMWQAVVIMTAALLVSGEPAQAANRESVALTVYNQNFALVKDVRVVDVTRGRTEMRIDDVAASIDPTSVHFTALDHPDAVAVLEQNYVYDLADASRLLNRYLDRPVTVHLAEGGAQKTGALLSQNEGYLVLGTGKGASIVSRAEVREVALGELPGGLVAKPALMWKLASERQGPERIELSYLTKNVTWHAEYVAVINAGDDGLILNGWVSLDNRSGADYENAKLKLVAGDVNRVRDEVHVHALRTSAAMSYAQEAIPGFEERAFFEYHVYELSTPATVADRETKQLALFPSARVPAQTKLTYAGTGGAIDSKVAIHLEFMNSKEEGLGIPLPQGKIRVYKEDADGAIEFVGEDRIDHTPRDESVRLSLGSAFDVVGEKRQTEYRRISEKESEVSYAIEIRNHKDAAVEVAVIEHFYSDWKITKSSQDFMKKDARTVEFPVKVPANGSMTVTYTVRTKY